MLETIKDKDAEVGVISGIFNNGHDGYLDVSHIVNVNSFTDDLHQIMYKIIESHYKNSTDNLDTPSFYSYCNSMGFSEIVNNPKIKDKIKSIFSSSVDIKSCRRLAAKVSKLEVGRNLRRVIEDVREKVGTITGEESLSEILSLAEQPLFEFNSRLKTFNQDGPKKIFENIEEYLDYLESNPVKQIGISTGFTQYDIAIGGGLRRKTVNMLGARAKCLFIEENIYTPQGVKKIKEIKEGDIICHPYDKTSKVVKSHEIFETDCFVVRFNDGLEVECCGEHIWPVYQVNNRDKYCLKTTNELANDLIYRYRKDGTVSYKWNVPITKEVYFEEKNVALDPYFLGLLIGDGCFGNSITYGSGDIELLDYITNKFENVKVDFERDNFTVLRLNGLQPIIRELGLFKVKSKDKFIPDVYKYNSVEIRLSILQGLMDTDGTSFIQNNKTSRCNFSTTSLQLAKDVREIVNSLGGTARLKQGYVNYKSEKRIYFTVGINLPEKYPLFRLPRKLNRMTLPLRTKYKRTIVSITPSGKKPVKCITTDKNDGLFITNNFLVTHNCGKSAFCANAAINLIGNQIPVYFADTELCEEDQKHRMLACLSGVPYPLIENGQYALNLESRKAVREAGALLKELPYYYRNISGMPFEDLLPELRRWITKSVGYKDGRTNDCVIIYDYIKLMTDSGLKNLQEFQALGFLMTGLHNFMVKYDCPSIATIQLNRDGITREDTDVAAGSDRLVWLCSNFTLFKKQSDEEISRQRELGIRQLYNRKFITLAARHGPGTDEGDYTNARFDGALCRITEGPLQSELGATNNNEGFVSNSNEPF